VFLFLIELFGAVAVDPMSRPLFPALGEFYSWFVGSGIILSVVAPITSMAALVKVLSQRNHWNGLVLIPLLTACVLSVAISVLGCAWTFLAHPTWTQGYSGRP
jgi:hypothetical protein